MRQNIINDEESSKQNNWYTKAILFYRFIGVCQFKKLLLVYESFLYGKNGRKNKNYHLDITSINSINRFGAYLFYNTFVHSVSLVLTVIYFIVTRYFDVIYVVLDVVMYLSCVLNVYCLLLQHYNYIRIKFFQKKYWLEKKRISKERDLSNFIFDINDEAISSYNELIQNILRCVKEDGKVFMDDSYVAMLDNMVDCLKKVGGQSTMVVKKKSGITKKNLDFEELLATCAELSKPYGRIEIRVNWLLKHVLMQKARNINERPIIVTIDSATEKKFKQVFTKNSLDYVFSTLELFKEIYRREEICDELEVANKSRNVHGS